jgi:hypothetical protein
MTERDNASTGQRPSAGASTFTVLSEEQWQAIRSIRNWPDGHDWRREIEEIGRNYWEAQTTRQMWVKRLHGKQPAEQRKKIYKALVSIRQSRNTLAALADDGLLDNDFPHPDLDSPDYRLEAWLSDYDIWVKPFAGKSNPIQAELERRLIQLWKRSRGKLAYSRKKEKGRSSRRAHTGRGATARDDQQDHADAERPNTPCGPLVDFLKLTLSAILGKALQPSGVAKVIDGHRGRRQRDNPFLMFAMDLRIRGNIDAAPLWD